MDIKVIRFGLLEIDGERYEDDLVIDGGKVRKRKKGPSRAYKSRYGHTPLSAEETIPWGGPQLIIGKGLYGRLPIMDEVFEEAEQRGVQVVEVRLKEACRRIRQMDEDEIYAILHLTC